MIYRDFLNIYTVYRVSIIFHTQLEYSVKSGHFVKLFLSNINESKFSADSSSSRIYFLSGCFGVIT